VPHNDPEFSRYFGVRSCLGSYGMTELIAPVILNDPWSTPRPMSLGRPSLGYAIRIVDDTGRPTPPGRQGNLQIGGVRSLSIFREYYGNAEATREAFTEDGFFRTGDVVTAYEDGWIHYNDRVKDVIKVGGEGVASSEVEAVIRALPEVRETGVVGRPDPVYGEVVVAFVELEATAPPDINERILAHCRASLAKFKVPREIIVLDKVPTIGNGKIHKVKLRESLKEKTPA
jgi:crotonobetaine/carnitine-CoA ligase